MNDQFEPKPIQFFGNLCVGKLRNIARRSAAAITCPAFIDMGRLDLDHFALLVHLWQLDSPSFNQKLRNHFDGKS